jgi:hypothetical protein
MALLEIVVQTIRLLLVPALIASGVMLFQRNPLAAIRTGQWIMAASALAVAGLGVTAAFSALRESGAHGMLGHLLTIFAWVGTWFSLGVVTARGLALKKWSGIIDGLLVIGSLGTIMLSGFAGYLYPHEQNEATRLYESAMLRFLVLHVVALPTFAIAFSAVAWMRFRAYRRTLKSVTQAPM